MRTCRWVCMRACRRLEVHGKRNAQGKVQLGNPAGLDPPFGVHSVNVRTRGRRITRITRSLDPGLDPGLGLGYAGKIRVCAAGLVGLAAGIGTVRRGSSRRHVGGVGGG